MTWKTKKVSSKEDTKKRKKYLTRRIKIARAKWGLVLGLTLIAGTVMWFYPQYIYEDMQYNLRVDNVEYKIVDKAPEIQADKTPDKKLSTREQIEQIAKIECDKRNLGDYCVKDLVAMAWTESRFDPKARGDSGNSIGAYQIHLGYHKHITAEQAEDINFATAWTINRLVHYGYPEFRSYAVQKHNGTPFMPKTLAYLQSVNNYIKTIK